MMEMLYIKLTKGIITHNEKGVKEDIRFAIRFLRNVLERTKAQCIEECNDEKHTPP